MMKRHFGWAALVGAVVLSSAILPLRAASGPLNSRSGAMMAAGIGKPAPDFALNASTGKPFSLAKNRSPKATVLMFISTTCAVSRDYNTRMVQVAKDYAPKGVRFVGLDANRTESAKDVNQYAKQYGFPFPVLMDVGNVVADQYQARVTPHAYVIDGQGVLRYVGRIDDSQDISNVKSKDLRAALNAVLAGRPVPVAETRAFGCSIRRVDKE